MPSSLLAHRRARRHRRVRARVRGTSARPRLSVFRSKRHLVLQLIDDDASRTLVAAYDGELTARRGGAAAGGETPGVSRARALGTLLAERAGKAGIARAVFDRGGMRYHGRVKAVAEGARAGGLRV